MKDKGIVYLRVFIWVLLLLTAILLQKGVTTFFANILEIDTGFLRIKDLNVVYKGTTIREFVLNSAFFILLIIFLLRYLLLSPFSIFSKIWEDSVELTKNLSDETIYSRFQNVNKSDVRISLLYLLIEFFISLYIILSLGNHQITFWLLLLLPFIDFVMYYFFKIRYIFLNLFRIIRNRWYGGLMYSNQVDIRLNSSRINRLIASWKKFAINDFFWANLADTLSLVSGVFFMFLTWYGIIKIAMPESVDGVSIYSFMMRYFTCTETIRETHLKSPVFYGIIIGLIISHFVNWPINKIKYLNAIDILLRVKRLSDRVHVFKLSRRLKGQNIFNDHIINLDYNVFIRRYESFEPLPYIQGRIMFYDLEFKLDRRCYIPNHETKILVEEVVKYVKRDLSKEKILIYDVGTGCGNISISLLKKVPQGTDLKIRALDIDQHALEVARSNIVMHNCQNDISLDLDDLVLNQDKQINPNIIVSDLPYGSLRTLLPSINREELAHYPPISLHAESSLGEYVRLIQQILDKGWKTVLFIETGVVSRKEIESTLNPKLFYPKNSFRVEVEIFNLSGGVSSDDNLEYTITRIIFGHDQTP